LGAPRNIYRHVIMSDIKDATTTLPRVTGLLQNFPESFEFKENLGTNAFIFIFSIKWHLGTYKQCIVRQITTALLRFSFFLMPLFEPE
jgi:hypothetical protein